MTDFSRGYSARWRVRRIDEATWLPMEEVGGICSVKVKRATNDESMPKLESGEMEVTGDFADGYYRIEMLTGSGGLVDVATLLFAPDGRSFSHGAWGGTVKGVSVLAQSAKRYLKPGAFAPAGTDGAAWCAAKLREVIPAPVVVAGSFELDSNVNPSSTVTSYLDLVWAVLGHAGWCMQIGGDGTVTIMPMPAEAALVLDSSTRGLLLPDVDSKLPIEDVPNVVRVYDGDDYAEAVNDDPQSPTSTVAMGRRIELVEDGPTRKVGETLDAYARRKLTEESDIYETRNIEREYAPGVLPYSLVECNLPERDMTGSYRVMSQTVTCSHGMKVGETLGRRANG